MDKKKIGIIAAVLLLIIVLIIGIQIYSSGDHKGPDVKLHTQLEVGYGEQLGLYDVVRSVSDQSSYTISITNGGNIAADGRSTVFSQAGSAQVEITATDELGHVTAVAGDVTVTDHKPPTIHANDITITLGDQVDYHTGVTAEDEMDGNLTGALQVDTSQVDETRAGVYPVIYSVSDKSGNTATIRTALTIQSPNARSITLSQQSISINGNGHYQLSANVEPRGWNGKLHWTTSDPSVAVVYNGLISWVGSGSCTVTASADGVESHCQVSCGKVNLSNITLNLTSITLECGEEETLEWKLVPSNYSGDLNWISSDPTIATVEDGKVVWAGEGECTITASADGKTAVCNVVCNKPVLLGIEFPEPEIKLPFAERITLEPVFTPEQWVGDLIWISSDPTTATVTDGVVQWMKPGTVTITVTADQLTASVTVICEEIPLQNITLNKNKLDLYKNKSFTLKATVLPVEWKGSLTWTSSDPSVASVKDGVVTWEKAGTCTITAYSGDVKATCTVTCKEESDFLDDLLNQITND